MLVPEDEDLAINAVRFSLASDIVELVVLTGDEIFLKTLREAVGAPRRLWHVPTGDKVSDLLVAGGVGILVLDAQAQLPERAPEFIAQINRQFPDLVVIVAGTRECESELGRLISDGTVYRFIHKPVSPGRARLFADAAVKRYEERHRSGALPMGGASSDAHRRLALIAGGTALALFALLIVGLAHHGAREPPAAIEPPPPAGAPLAQPPEAPAEHDQLMARAENTLSAQLAKSLEQKRAPPAAPKDAAPKDAPPQAPTARVSAAPEPPPAHPAPEPAPPQEPAAAPAPAAPVAELPQAAPPIPAAALTAAEVPRTEAPRPAEPPPRLLKSVSPSYPYKAQHEGIEGWVDLEFTVTERGEVTAIQVLASDRPGVFEQAAIAALSRFKYQPMQKERRARIRIRFALPH